MATFWEIAARAVDHVFPFCTLNICNTNYFQFWFSGLYSNLGSRTCFDLSQISETQCEQNSDI